VQEKMDLFGQGARKLGCVSLGLVKIEFAGSRCQKNKITLVMVKEK